MHRFMLTVLLLLFVRSWAQDDNERVYAVSCSLYVKTSPYMPDSGDASGRALVEATFCDKAGIPIPDQKIKMTATCGTLSCLPSNTIGAGDSASSGRSCFVTDKDGKIQVSLINIPFNKPGRVRASCTYGDLKVHASSSFSITRKVVKKRTAKKSSPVPASVQP